MSGVHIHTIIMCVCMYMYMCLCREGGRVDVSALCVV